MEDAQLTDLVRRHAGLIHKIAYAYGRDASDREDVVQEVLVQLWRSRAKYDARFKETTWVWRIALNVAISFQRRERRHREGRRELDLHAHDTHEPIHAITIAAAEEPGEDVQRLLACIEDLNTLERALVLLYLDGNDHPSISDVLGISVSNVGTKLGRIKDKLRVAFERRTRSNPKDWPHATR